MDLESFFSASQFSMSISDLPIQPIFSVDGPTWPVTQGNCFGLARSAQPWRPLIVHEFPARERHTRNKLSLTGGAG